MLAALEKSWHALPSTYRLACHAELSKDSLTITDVAISAANPECAQWDGREPSFVIASTNLIMRRGTFNADCVVTCVVSLHAAACRLQWGISASSDDDLLDDVALLAQHNATEMIPEGQDFAVHTAGGSWRGRGIRLPDGGRRTLSVRTWLPE
jgi:hypothetical protein